MKKGIQTMKRVLSFVMAFAMVLTLLPAAVFAADSTKTIYLKAGIWDQANAWFDAWVWGSSTADAWYTFADKDGDLVYEIEIPADATGMKVLRKDPATTDHNHDVSWNDSGDLTINSGYNCYEVTDWSAGRWITYDPTTATPVPYTVAGSEALCGTDWDTGNTANDMEKKAVGLYEKVYTDVAAGTYEFKVVANHSWAKSWGDTSTSKGDAKVTVDKDGSTVTIIFNTGTSTVSATVTAPKTSYTVTFNSNGGSSVETQTVEDGKTVSEPAAPTKGGYTFDAWYSDEGLTTAYDFNNAVTSNLTLYAKWTKLEEDITIYTVTFDKGDGSESTTVTVNDGEKVAEPADPTRVGYTFGGWFAVGAQETYNFDAPVYENLELTAKWTQIVLNVVFVTGTDDATVGSQNPHYGELVTEPSDDPTRDGYTFGGWYTDKACENAYDFTAAVTSDLTLYAKWTKNETEPGESETITVYFRNDWLWPEVRIHYWGSTTAAGTEWPGAVMQLVENETNIYFAEIPADVAGIAFNGEKNDNSGTIQKTVDITTGIQDENGYFIVYDGSDETETDNYGTFTYTPGGGGEGSDIAAAYYLVGYINNADYNGQDYQFVNGTLDATFANDSYVVVKDQTGDWYMTAEYCTEASGTFAKGNKEKMFVAAGSYTFTLVENDDGTLTMSYASASGGEGGEVEPAENVSYAATFHFANTLNWSTVNLYTWIGSGTTLTGTWPGSATTVANGYYSKTVEFEAPEGTALNFIFNNGSAQTVDLTLSAEEFTLTDDVYKAEKWVVLTTKDGEKYNAAVVDSPESIVTSPIVDGSSVTFNYGGSADSVSVAGTFNDWSATANPMTKGEDGVWTLTVKDLAAGDYQYKFVVDGEYIIDPMNGNVGTDKNENQNSVFYILSDETTEDDNTVTINVHYTRTDGNYDGWNLWVWGTNMGGHQVDFETTDDDGAKVATIVLENAREYQDISFKERLSVEGNEWKDQGSADRRIDLSTVVSGTIDYYIPSGKCEYGDDVIRKNKISSVELDYDGGVVVVTSVQAIAKPEEALSLIKGEGQDAEKIDVTITSVGSRYSLVLPEGTVLELSDLYLYKVDYYGDLYTISIDAVYASEKFASEYTYEGKDLGAVINGDTTTFKVWAPTAEAVSVNLYTSGTEGTEDLIKSVPMSGGTKDDKGVWTVTVNENLNGTYYTYAVTVDGKTVEAVDPYARTTGVNGERGMVIDLDSTDPTGWANDENPNKITSYTDAVIYELHVRDFSNHKSSGMTNKGKYLAFTEEGTTTSGGAATGIDYLDELGVTHVHLLPVYDYGSVEEDKLDTAQFNWGYDPVNYNVPEGSYSTDPYDGAKRVSEFKQMVKSLHDHDISVIMDVVYNHVYDAEEFCFNNIVPGYFSRVSSNASGCGNDTASEREMVRKYIVESVLYWHQEYHIDGFRFDLVGLLDVETINQIVKEVHACCPDVIFYGEGWDMDSTNKEPGTQMAKQGNASLTSGFAYFSDSVRNGVSGGNDGNSTGFASGAGNGGAMVTEWMANPWWTNNPEQVVQYVSCHDNYTLADKLVLSTGKSKIDDTVIKMNNLSAAFYMTAQGISFIHAGEEFLREKINSDGSRNHNSYNSSDAVNNIVWSNLENETYAANVEYYKGLIAFRKAHPALRYSTATEVKDNVQTYTASGNLIAMRVDGYGANDDDIFVIFNANTSAQTVDLPEGEWTININGTKAGTDSLGTATGSVSVAGISAMMLTREDEGKDEAAPVGPSEQKTIYFSNNKHWNEVYAYAWDSNGNVVTGESWPGVAMTYVETNDYNEKIYSITLPASDVGIAGVVFHNNEGTQTVNVVPGVDGTGYYCTDVDSEGHYEVSTYAYRAPVIGTAEDYYLVGWINNTNYTGSEYKLDQSGKLTTTFEADSYVYVVNGDSSENYMTDGYLGAVKSAVLKNTSKYQATDPKGWDKLLIPGGEEVVITMVKNDDNTITLSYESSTTAVVDQSGVQDGVTLHCWNWSFDNITANMAKIAEQGYTAIQTSPIQPLKEATNLTTNTVGSHWWIYYQPVDFVITTDEGNALGTKADFVEMCAEAEKYGIKVIVDVVANHLGNKTGNNLADAIPDYLRKDEYWHDISVNISSWESRENMTQYCMDGLPDLNTANDDIQNYVLAFLKECVDAGADGFRFDAAKSIETPRDDAAFASDFWPTVVNGIQKYAGGDLYIYGEILDEAAIAISAYTQYMSVTDNGWGNDMRNKLVAGTANLVDGFYKTAPAANLVIWAESHDTYATNDESLSSADVSEVDINKTWALVAARADAMGLYFARPASNSQALGVASATGWANKEVKAVNEFHNTFNGQSETIGNSGNISYVVRGTTGVVLVNVAGTTAEVSSLNVGMTDGTYADQITGNTFTVADGKISGTIGDTGIAVVHNVENAEKLFEIEKTNMRFGSDLSLLFAFKQSNLSDITGCYAEITKTVTGGDSVVATSESGEWTTLTMSGETYYVVEFAGFAAKEMTDEVTVRLYDADGNALSKDFETSIQTYAMERLSATTNEKFKVALVDMLNYGTAAQNQYGYNTADLANAQMNNEQKELASEEGIYADCRDKGDETIFGGSNLRFESKINLLFALDISEDTYAVFTWEDHNGGTHSKTITSADYATLNGKKVVELDELVVADARQLVTCTIYNSRDNNVVTTVKDSVESNAARVSAAYRNLYVSFMKFADSAHAYLHS